MLFEISKAAISACQRYRYQLTRQWNHELETVVFVMLNPSTADANTNDPTIRRCLNFAHDWGFGGIKVVNLFAWRATNPAELRTSVDPIGPENDEYLTAAFLTSPVTVVAWGAGAPVERVQQVAALLQTANITPHCLGTTQAGHPRHPLYVPRNRQRELFAISFG